MKLRLVVHLKGELMFKNVKDLIQTIKKIVFVTKYNIQIKFKLIDRNTVYFEGGLGSQILAYIHYRDISQNNKTKVFADFSYFNKIKVDTHKQNSPTLWTYKLGRYGIEISDFPLREKKNRFLIKPIFLPMNFNESNRNLIKEIKSEIKINYSGLVDYLNQFGVTTSEEYCCIHIRKGDYIAVASYLIDTKQILNLIDKIQEFLPNKIFIVSDGEVDSELLEYFENTFPEKKVLKPLNNEDAYLLHDLMRNSKILIAANSTFSFSAALLSSENTIAFIPQIFYAQDLNRNLDTPSHRFSSDYAILKF